jgi:hypothetical protein
MVVKVESLEIGERCEDDPRWRHATFKIGGLKVGAEIVIKGPDAGCIRNIMGPDLIDRGGARIGLPLILESYLYDYLLSRQPDHEKFVSWRQSQQPVKQNQKRIVEEVLEERRRQDEEWGGPAGFDAYTPDDWYDLIAAHNSTGWQVVNDAQRERCLIQIAALAIAAVESSRRLDLDLHVIHNYDEDFGEDKPYSDEDAIADILAFGDHTDYEKLREQSSEEDPC